MRAALVILLFLAPMTAPAESRLPFGKNMAGDQELPRPWGIGFDFYTMDQDYSIESLSFVLPGVSLPDASSIVVTNEIQHWDFKADVWLLPFLNVFAVAGHVESDTVVDLSEAPIMGLPITLGNLPISTDGTVLGGGLTLAYGGPGWFTSLTATYTDTDLGGDFDSNAETLTLQPRLGFIRNQWVGWVGAMYLDVEESHSGSIELPGIGRVPFSVVLGTQDEWNTVVGARHHFSDRTSLSLEFGFGDREHTLFNYNYRF